MSEDPRFPEGVVRFNERAFFEAHQIWEQVWLEDRDIRARRIIVEGSVEGNLYALESVTLKRGAAVRGDVFAAGVAMEDGARLTGRIDMDNAPTVPTVKVPLPDATESATGELSAAETEALIRTD